MDTVMAGLINGELGHLFTEAQADQTVPNAEHQALYRALIAIVYSPSVIHGDIHTDCQMVYEGYIKGRLWTSQQGKTSTWEEMWDMIEQLQAGGTTIIIHKVKAHETDLTIAPLHHRIGNDFADKEAKMAARHHDLPLQQRLHVKNLEGQSWLTRERMISIIKSLPKRVIPLDPKHKGRGT